MFHLQLSCILAQFGIQLGQKLQKAEAMFLGVTMVLNPACELIEQNRELKHIHDIPSLIISHHCKIDSIYLTMKRFDLPENINNHLTQMAIQR